MRMIPDTGAAFCSPASAMQMLFAVRPFFFFFFRKRWESVRTAHIGFPSAFPHAFRLQTNHSTDFAKKKKNLNFSGFSRAPGEMRQEITR